jgi:hypothetical protein
MFNANKPVFKEISHYIRNEVPGLDRFYGFPKLITILKTRLSLKPGLR